MIYRLFSNLHYKTALSSAYLLHTSFRFLSRYHFDTNPLPSNTFPVPCYHSISRLYTLHLPIFTFYFTPLFLLSNAVLHSLEQKQSISLIFIYFYRAHREKVFVCRKFSEKSPAVCIPYSIREVNDNLKIA